MISRSKIRRDDQGYVLLLALGFVTFVGVIAVALVSYTTTNLRATIDLRQVRAEQFAADGAVDGAINAVRNSASPPPANCFNAALNKQQIRVDCSGAFPEVTFTACLETGSACSSISAILVAEATIVNPGPVNSGPVTVNSWSERR
jgi:Tfp pilus assembly protein PilX